MTEDELFARILADPDVYPRHRYLSHLNGGLTPAVWFGKGDRYLCVVYSFKPLPGIGEGRDREVITRFVIQHHGVRNVSEALGYTQSRYRGLTYEYVIVDEVVNVDIPI